MSGPTGYSVVSYGGMVACEPRMSSYAEALRRAVTPRCMVIDIGAGPGVFSLLACQYGAGSVVAVEPDDSIELLRQAAKENGFEDRITIFQGLSTDLKPSRKADVIVSDCRGGLPLFENHIATIVDARERLLASGGQLIPARDTLHVALIEEPKEYAACAEPWNHNRYGLNLSAGHRFAVNSFSKVRLGADVLLTEPAELATLDYRSIDQSNLACTAELQLARAGTAHGILIWFDAELAPGIGYSNAPGQPPQIYGQTFLPFERPVDAAAGDRAQVEITADLVDGEYVWGWNSQIQVAATTQPITFRQSSFLGKIFSPRSLEARADSHVPLKTEIVDIDVFILSLVNSSRSLGAIAAEVRVRFPEQFSSDNAALNRVANLTARYR